MNFKQPNISTKTKLYGSLARTSRVVLEGRGLVLDPSCGSMSSQPGYAIYSKGVLEDKGTIQIPLGRTLQERLHYLATCLRNEFPEKFDYVVIEEVPVLRFNKFGRSLKGQVSLHYAVGVMMSAFPVDLFLQITPATWRSFASDEHIEKKALGHSTDEDDAQCMGYAVIEIAKKAAAQGKTKKKRRGKK